MNLNEFQNNHEWHTWSHLEFKIIKTLSTNSAAICVNEHEFQNSGTH